MIRVEVPTPAAAEWLDWRAKAEAETASLIAGGPPYKIKSDLYKGMKDVLFDAFHGKCAYCECDIKHSQPGDVEHFRPKAGVIDENDAPVRTADGRPHPGYYWLAYAWINLLPSCAGCNRLTRAPDGKLVGKGERFPLIRDGGLEVARAAEPGAEDQERPLFIHPVLEDPAAHVQYDPATGLLIGLTERGQRCVDLLGLNRDALVELRRESYDAMILRVDKAFSEELGSAISERYMKRIDACKLGRDPFSLVGRTALREWKKAKQDFLSKL